MSSEFVKTSVTAIVIGKSYDGWKDTSKGTQFLQLSLYAGKGGDGKTIYRYIKVFPSRECQVIGDIVAGSTVEARGELAAPKIWADRNGVSRVDEVLFADTISLYGVSGAVRNASQSRLNGQYEPRGAEAHRPTAHNAPSMGESRLDDEASDPFEED
jgi:hypothetical protein